MGKVNETMMRIAIGFFGLGIAAMMLACSPAAQTAAAEPSSAVQTSSDLFIRLIKTTAEADKGVLEMWNRGEDGQFHLTQTYEMCTWSGALGPKLKEGDGQSPEGFYFIKPSSLNPNSSYHLSFNLGFPNA